MHKFSQNLNDHLFKENMKYNFLTALKNCR